MTRTYHHLISLGLNCEPSYAYQDDIAEFDSVHSSFPEVHVHQRTQSIQRHLEMRREERLRDIRARTRQSGASCR